MDRILSSPLLHHILEKIILDLNGSDLIHLVCVSKSCNAFLHGHCYNSARLKVSLQNKLIPLVWKHAQPQRIEKTFPGRQKELFRRIFIMQGHVVICCLKSTVQIFDSALEFVKEIELSDYLLEGDGQKAQGVCFLPIQDNYIILVYISVPQFCVKILLFQLENLRLTLLDSTQFGGTDPVFFHIRSYKRNSKWFMLELQDVYQGTLYAYYTMEKGHIILQKRFATNSWPTLDYVSPSASHGFLLRKENGPKHLLHNLTSTKQQDTITLPDLPQEVSNDLIKFILKKKETLLYVLSERIVMTEDNYCQDSLVFICLKTLSITGMMRNTDKELEQVGNSQGILKGWNGTVYRAHHTGWHMNTMTCWTDRVTSDEICIGDRFWKISPLWPVQTPIKDMGPVNGLNENVPMDCKDHSSFGENGIWLFDMDYRSQVFGTSTKKIVCLDYSEAFEKFGDLFK